MALSPNVIWAQTKDAVFMTVELQQNKDVSVQLKDEFITIKAKADGKDYECTVQFYKPIKASEAMKSTDRYLRFKLPKTGDEKWPTLNSDGKKHWIKIDWDRWVESDDEDDEKVTNDFDMSAFENMDQFNDMEMVDDDEEEEHPHGCCGEGHDCCSKGKCPCEKCECGSVCGCGRSCKCEDCHCDSDCNCGDHCVAGEQEGKGCKCCDSCTCGDNCKCTPEEKCSPACSCPTAMSSCGKCSCSNDCGCGGDCKCTIDSKCNPACSCAVGAC